MTTTTMIAANRRSRARRPRALSTLSGYPYAAPRGGQIESRARRANPKSFFAMGAHPPESFERGPQRRPVSNPGEVATERSRGLGIAPVMHNTALAILWQSGALIRPPRRGRGGAFRRLPGPAALRRRPLRRQGDEPKTGGTQGDACGELRHGYPPAGPGLAW